MRFALALATVLLSPFAVLAITINTVPIGNPGNPQRINDGGINVGSVATTYKIGSTEVTNAQYVQFLNAVAATDSHGLYNTNMGFYSSGGIVRSGSSGSYAYSVKADVPDGGPDETNYAYGDKPVTFVSWYDAARFTNWLNNGATASSSTETGAYTLSVGVGVSRSSGATWFLPNEDEWYKAAYYDGTNNVYYNFSTKSNSTPNNAQPLDDTGNSVNYFAGDFTQNDSYPLTAAGAYADSKSAYNTFDQGGNVWEWTETYQSSSQKRVRRGGAWDTDSTTIGSNYRELKLGTLESEDMGFRVAMSVGPTLPGDYNGNNVVDAADYVTWRKNLNRPVTLPNDTTPSSVASGDYDVWRQHFGQTSTGSGPSFGAVAAAVPEPTTCVLLATAVLAARFVRRRKPKLAL